MIRKEEFEKILLRKDMISYILRMSDEVLIENFGSEYAMMRGFSQNNPHHCYSLLEHILYATEWLDIKGLSENEALDLKAAAFFHDIGKLRAAKEKDGRTVFYGHAAISCAMARSILEEIGYCGDELERICFYIEYHDSFIIFKREEDIKAGSIQLLINESNIRSVIIKSQKQAKKSGAYVPKVYDYILLMRLCMSDAMAQAESTYINGRFVDSRDNKLKRAAMIKEVLENMKE